MTQWFNFYSFDVMGDLAFSSSFDMIVNGKAHWAIQLLKDGMAPLGLGFPMWFWRVLLSLPGLTGGFHKFILFCKEQIDNRVAKQDKIGGQDVAHYLVDGYKKSGESKVEYAHLIGDSRLIIVAGSDTTAATLTHLFYFLAKYPEVVKNLREEIKGKLEGKEISNSKLNDAAYLVSLSSFQNLPHFKF